MEESKIKTIKAFLSKDASLKKIIDSTDFPEIKRTNNVFHDLMSCLLEQQIHYRSSKRIVEKALRHAGIKELTLTNFHKLEEVNFHGARMSLAKMQTMMSVIKLFSENEINWFELENDEVRTLLEPIKGIGRKTVDSILLYSLGREDIFIPDDYHIEKIMCNLFEINSKSRLKAKISSIANDWSPYKSYAFLYLLESKQKVNFKNS